METGQDHGNRPHRHKWELHTWKHSLRYPSGEPAKQTWHSALPFRAALLSLRLFTEYVRNCLDNQLWRTLEEYLTKTDPSELDLRLNKVKTPGEIELYDTDMKFVEVTDLPGSMISFDVVLDATMIIYDEDRNHNDDSESDHQWLMISCRGNLDKRLSDMEITGVEEYCGRTRKDRSLSDSLVPVICRDDLERVADDFLKKYYPEARLQPMWVDPSKLVKRMGLAVISHTISGTVFSVKRISSFSSSEFVGLKLM